MTNIALGILIALHEQKEIKGTECLAQILSTRKERVIANSLMLAKYGLIQIEFGNGRGHPTTYRDAGVLKVKR